MKVAYCEFQLDFAMLFSLFFTGQTNYLSIETYGSFLLGRPVPISVVIRRQHCLASTQTVEKKQLLWPEEISPEATRSTARVLSYGWSFSLHDLESANQGDFSRLYIFKPCFPSAVFAHFSTKNLINPVMQALTLVLKHVLENKNCKVHAPSWRSFFSLSTSQFIIWDGFKSYQPISFSFFLCPLSRMDLRESFLKELSLYPLSLSL